MASETKAVEPEPLVYANKMVWESNTNILTLSLLMFLPGHQTFAICSFQEAKDAFKALLESVNVGSDWTWDRVVISYIFFTHHLLITFFSYFFNVFCLANLICLKLLF